MVPRTVLAIVLACAVLCIGLPRDAAASPELAAVLVKAMGYDRKLTDRAGSRVLIAVVAPPGHGPAQSLLRYLTAVNGFEINGKPLEVQLVEMDGQWSRRVEELGVDFICVPEELSARRLEEILSTSQRLAVPSAGLSSDVVQRGVSLGVGAVRRKPRIYVNLRAAQQQGAKYSSDLLQLAKRVN